MTRPRAPEWPDRRGRGQPPRTAANEHGTPPERDAWALSVDAAIAEALRTGRDVELARLVGEGPAAFAALYAAALRAAGVHRRGGFQARWVSIDADVQAERDRDQRRRQAAAEHGYGAPPPWLRRRIERLE